MCRLPWWRHYEYGTVYLPAPNHHRQRTLHQLQHSHHDTVQAMHQPAVLSSLQTQTTDQLLRCRRFQRRHPADLLPSKRKKQRQQQQPRKNYARTRRSADDIVIRRNHRTAHSKHCSSEHRLNYSDTSTRVNKCIGMPLTLSALCTCSFDDAKCYYTAL